jgi:hypothetical protein
MGREIQLSRDNSGWFDLPDPCILKRAIGNERLDAESG